MARPNKIEQYKLQHMVARCLTSGENSVRKIAAALTKEVKDKGTRDEISPAAVQRYLETAKYEKPTPTLKKKAAVTNVPGRVERIVNFDIDIIDFSTEQRQLCWSASNSSRNSLRCSSAEWIRLLNRLSLRRRQIRSICTNG